MSTSAHLEPQQPAGWLVWPQAAPTSQRLEPELEPRLDPRLREAAKEKRGQRLIREVAEPGYQIYAQLIFILWSTVPTYLTA